MPESFGDQTVLITGASSGIGWELAKLFAKNNFSLVLTARNESRLKDLANELKTPVTIIAKDLSLSTSPREIYDELQMKNISIDILVNNAGFGTHGFFTDTDFKKELALIQVNISALTHLTKLFLPGMVERNQGRILNVASTAAFQPGPLMANYYASKAYVLSLSEALSHELRNTNITVTALCPGPTRTEFQKRANMQDIKLLKTTIMNTDKVAEIGYRGMMQGKRVVIPGFKNKILSYVARALPNSFIMPIILRMQENR